MMTAMLADGVDPPLSSRRRSRRHSKEAASRKSALGIVTEEKEAPVQPDTYVNFGLIDSTSQYPTLSGWEVAAATAKFHR